MKNLMESRPWKYYGEGSQLCCGVRLPDSDFDFTDLLKEDAAELRRIWEREGKLAKGKEAVQEDAPVFSPSHRRGSLASACNAPNVARPGLAATVELGAFCSHLGCEEVSQKCCLISGRMAPGQPLCCPIVYVEKLIFLHAFTPCTAGTHQPAESAPAQKLPKRRMKKLMESCTWKYYGEGSQLCCGVRLPDFDFDFTDLLKEDVAELQRIWEREGKLVIGEEVEQEEAPVLSHVNVTPVGGLDEMRPFGSGQSLSRTDPPTEMRPVTEVTPVGGIPEMRPLNHWEGEHAFGCWWNALRPLAPGPNRCQVLYLHLRGCHGALHIASVHSVQNWPASRVHCVTSHIDELLITAALTLPRNGMQHCHITHGHNLKLWLVFPTRCVTRKATTCLCIYSSAWQFDA